MNYLTKNVGRDDHVVEAVQINYLAMLSAIIWGIIFFVAGYNIRPREFSPIFYCIGAVIIVVKFFDIKCTHLGYTTKKVIGKSGVLSTKSMDAPLNKVDNVSVSKTIFGMIFNYSNLQINTSSGVYKFKYIKNVDIFKQNFMDHIDAYEKQKLNEQAEQIYRMNAGRN